MAQTFFEKPILNSPYQYPARHWKLDTTGQPTDTILPERRQCAYVGIGVEKSWRKHHPIPHH